MEGWGKVASDQTQDEYWFPSFYIMLFKIYLWKWIHTLRNKNFVLIVDSLNLCQQNYNSLSYNLKSNIYFYFTTHYEDIVFTNHFITTYFQNNSNTSKTRLVIISLCSISTLIYAVLTYLNGNFLYSNS